MCTHCWPVVTTVFEMFVEGQWCANSGAGSLCLPMRAGDRAVPRQGRSWGTHHRTRQKAETTSRPVIIVLAARSSSSWTALQSSWPPTFRGGEQGQSSRSRWAVQWAADTSATASPPPLRDPSVPLSSSPSRRCCRCTGLIARPLAFPWVSVRAAPAPSTDSITAATFTPCTALS